MKKNTSTVSAIEYLIGLSLSGSLLPEQDIHKVVLGMITDLADFDAQLEGTNFDAIDFKTKTLSADQKARVAVAIRIIKQRNLLLKHFGITEEDHYITEPQKVPIIPTAEAFIFIGEHKLDIKENKNEYNLIFG